jgi:trimeric autotransporter adhesin
MTYVSALEAQADPGIVSGSTIERKKMSTKTIYKRIALVAVAALGMGVLTSVSPASAANTIIWCHIADGVDSSTYGSTTTGNEACNGVAGPANSVQLEFAAASVDSRLTVTGPGTFGAAGDTAELAVATNGLSATILAAGNQSTTVSVATPTVGTVTVSYFELVAAGSTIYKTTATETVTITVNAAAISGGINSATSTSLMKAAATYSTVSKDDVVLAAASATATTPVAAIEVALTGTAGAITSTTAVKVSVSGPGLLYLNNNNDLTTSLIGSGRSLASTIASTTSTFHVFVAPDGNPGVATITITAGTFTATETVTFYGTVATLTATPLRGSILDTHSGTGAGDTAGYAAVITAKDSAGNTVPVGTGDFTPVTSAQLTAAGITAAGFASANAGTYGTVKLDGAETVVVIDPTDAKTGVKSLTITHTTTTKTVVVPFTVGLAKATTAVLSTDKATYLPGEKITLTLTLKDAGGFATADDGTGTNVLAAGGITSNVSLVGDTTTAVDVPTVGGKKTWTLYAPLSAGPIVFAGKTGAGSGVPATAVTLAATATVSDSASMQSLTTLINSLIAKINALSKLVAKIQKKVKA